MFHFNSKVFTYANAPSLVLNTLPTAVMTCDLETSEIEHASEKSIELLKSLRHLLPTDPEAIVGTSINVVRKNPSHQRRILSAPRGLPHQANIKSGPETLSVQVSAMMDHDGSYLGPMLTWSVVAESVRMAESVSKVVDAITVTSSEMDGSARSLPEVSGNAVSLSASLLRRPRS